jgi:hypothetical protein
MDFHKLGALINSDDLKAMLARREALCEKIAEMQTERATIEGRINEMIGVDESPKQERKCSKCGKPGHTARTCRE